MTFRQPSNQRDAIYLARDLLGKAVLSWGSDRPLENRANGTMMFVAYYEVVFNNVKLKVHWTYDHGQTWTGRQEDWFMVGWSFQTVADWDEENRR